MLALPLGVLPSGGPAPLPISLSTATLFTDREKFLWGERGRELAVAPVPPKPPAWPPHLLLLCQGLKRQRPQWLLLQHRGELLVLKLFGDLRER